MTLTWINRKRLDIDLEEELKMFEWEKPKWIDERLIAASPFRYDKAPSFFVNLENLPDKEIAGTWKDSGADIGSEYSSGNFLTLLAYLRRETEEETEVYLLEKYDYKAYSKLKLKLNLKLKVKPIPLPRPRGIQDVIYLPSRGISYEVAYESDSIISPDGKTLALLWKNPQGEILAIKYRKTDSKIFFYEKDGYRLNELLYGLDYVYLTNPKTIAITEAEIDSLSWRTLGRASVAVGGSSFSDTQAELLKRTGAENLIISVDNDRVGQKLAREIISKVGAYFNVYFVKYPSGIKDMNEFILKFPNQLPKLTKLKLTLF
ncbi:hypothetical protein CON64_18580 [Bacillus pseudomycoides]|nr:hypothetical protein CON64_18580 [Bacillus pseudomycoides]